VFQIDNQSRQAVYEQIIEQVEKYVLSGVLKEGEKMPSTRNMALMLNVNPNTVQRAYMELERSAVIVTAPGRGAFVCNPAVLRQRKNAAMLENFKELLNQLAEAGLTKAEIIQIIEEKYKQQEGDLC